ncbi:MAG: hypothetical protein IJC30_03950 [Alphaproteobacteria bacterium]|nr:hypothetical protein [Alphaproteobacteria bacterium]
MDETNILSMIVNTATSPSLIVILLGIISAMAFTALFVTKIGHIILPAPKETRVADFLPFAYLEEDGYTIHCKEGTIARVYEIKGKDVSLVMPEEREVLFDARQRWVDSMSEGEIIARIITTREYLPLKEYDTQTDSFLKQVSKAWTEGLHRIYRNKHYLILSVKDRKNARQDFDQACNAMTAILEEYKPVLISEKRDDPSVDKSPFYLFAKLASPLSRPKPVIGKEVEDVLNSMLTADYIHFTKDKGIIRYMSGQREKLGIAIGIRKTGDFMEEQMIADILSIDVEMNVVHNIQPIPFIKATAILMQQKRQAAVLSPSGSVQAQYAAAMEMLDQADANAQTLNRYAMTVYIFGDSEEEINFGQEEVERICRFYNITPVREGWGAQAAFFSQFPSYDIYPRTYMYMSRVVAAAIGLERTTEGHMNSDWGEGPISYFRTITGTAYAFQFHVTDAAYAVAHTALIGPTGQGKTTLFSFLAGQAMRIPDLNVYFFDRGLGARVFAYALDAPYIRFEGGKDATTLNPFATPDTPDTRAFLKTWLRDITGGEDPKSSEEIARAITTAFEYLRPNERILKNLYKSCFSPNSLMRGQLKRWIDDDQYGRIFNAEQDNLDLNANKYMAFDFTRIFDDKTLAPAVISYIMHRIHTMATMRGTPSLIMIDETAPMLEHPMFRNSFIVGLREGRKRRQAFLCAFQQPNFLEAQGLGDAVRGQCQTVIFFRNPQASARDYESWNLSPRELNFILGNEFNDRKYAILISRPVTHESVILDVDLSPLGPLLKFYSSGNKNVILAQKLSAQIPERNAFLKAFLESA